MAVQGGDEYQKLLLPLRLMTPILYRPISSLAWFLEWSEVSYGVNGGVIVMVVGSDRYLWKVDQT